MHYSDGTVIEPGDIVRIDGMHRGRVIASIDTGRYLPGQETWSYLESGIIVDTDFGGFVHYIAESADCLELVERMGSS
jgi:hypothetical protein